MRRRVSTLGADITITQKKYLNDHLSRSVVHAMLFFDLGTNRYQRSIVKLKSNHDWCVFEYTKQDIYIYMPSPMQPYLACHQYASCLWFRRDQYKESFYHWPNSKWISEGFTEAGAPCCNVYWELAGVCRLSNISWPLEGEGPPCLHISSIILPHVNTVRKYERWSGGGKVRVNCPTQSPSGQLSIATGWL